MSEPLNSLSADSAKNQADSYRIRKEAIAIAAT